MVDRPFACERTDGHAIRVLDRLAVGTGVVLDLGCGFGAPAEEIARRGLTYVGVDLDPVATSDLRARAIEAHAIDLRDADPLPEALTAVLDGRRLAAVLLLDVLGYVPDPAQLLRALRTFLRHRGVVPLIVSVPNVAHLDVAIRLLCGQWLPDPGRLQHFSAERMDAESRAAGLVEVAAEDVVADRAALSDADHPLLARDGRFFQAVASFGASSDGTGLTSQFVRAFRVGPAGAAEVGSERVGPFLTVLVGYDGRDVGALEETVTALAGQTSDDFEIDLVVRTPVPSRVSVARELVDGFPIEFRSRVRVHHSERGTRAGALNEGLTRARGRYVAALAEGDTPFGHWVETFQRGAAEAPGHIVRCGVLLRRGADERWVGAPETAHLGPYVQYPNRGDDDGHGLRWTLAPGSSYAGPRLALTALRSAFALGDRLRATMAPGCSYAVPRLALSVLGATYDERLAAGEDWALLGRVTDHCGVNWVDEVTSVRRAPPGQDGSAPPAHALSAAIEDLRAGRLRLPDQAVSRLVELVEDERLARFRQQIVRVRRTGPAIRAAALWKATYRLRRLQYLRRQRSAST